MLVLGTAQLGLPYGIANRTGQPNQTVATNIIREAWENGIQEFDTAQGYGESERVLGKSLLQLKLLDKVKVITKPHPLLDHLDPVILENAVEASLNNIGVPQLFCVMLHREEMLTLWDKGLADILSRLVETGRVQKIGVSVYSPEKAIEALNTEGIDIVQVPTNILDRRFEQAGVFELARARGKQIYIRSVYLQGLVLMDSNEIPDRLSFACQVINKIESLANMLRISRQELALGYIKGAVPDAKVVIGIDLPEQVAGNCHAWRRSNQASLVSCVRECFPEVDAKILNPALWPV
jgi:aryl-alcohol dehydrogenase-like predicted oxidoreductase